MMFKRNVLSCAKIGFLHQKKWELKNGHSHADRNIGKYFKFLFLLALAFVTCYIHSKAAVSLKCAKIKIFTKKPSFLLFGVKQHMGKTGELLEVYSIFVYF